VKHSKVLFTNEGDGKSGRDITHLLPYINIDFQLRNFQAVEILLPVAEWGFKRRYFKKICTSI